MHSIPERQQQLAVHSLFPHSLADQGVLLLLLHRHPAWVKQQGVQSNAHVSVSSLVMFVYGSWHNYTLHVNAISNIGSLVQGNVKFVQYQQASKVQH
jgi:accessory gene regulator protein AgrB